MTVEERLNELDSQAKRGLLTDDEVLAQLWLIMVQGGLSTISEKLHSIVF